MIEDQKSEEITEGITAMIGCLSRTVMDDWIQKKNMLGTWLY
jgi:hypothetical protein